MELPKDYKFTKEHEWIKVVGSNILMGISEFAQNELGDIIFVELPAVGRQIVRGEAICVVESTKAASDVYAAVGGVVSEINSTLRDNPELVNSSPYQAGWLIKLEQVSMSELDALMSAEQYQAFLDGNNYV